MGKIVGIGGGFGGRDEDFLIRHVLTLSGKERPAYLQIPTTQFDLPDKGKLSRFSNWGCEVDVLCLSHDGH